MNNQAWPYPRWVAHRGAGKLAPENTLAAFRLGAHYGYRMFECDAKLSADGVPFLMHDAELNRTTNACVKWGSGVGTDISNIGGDHHWLALSQLDAGSWHSRSYAGEALATLDNIGAYILRNGFCLNIEIKPTPGTERHTGEVVASEAARIWRGTGVAGAVQPVYPLLSSFKVEALQGAKAAAPHLPRALLLETPREDWMEVALQLDCVAIVCNQNLWDASAVKLAQSAGFKCLSYTVNDESAAQRLLDLGTDGIITDRVDLFAPG